MISDRSLPDKNPSKANEYPLRTLMIDSFADSATQERISHYLDQPLWAFGWGSRKSDPYRFWNAILSDEVDGKVVCKDVVRDIWEAIKKLIAPNAELVKVYANAHTYGCEGYPHTDYYDTNEKYCEYWTAVYYPHERWEKDWAGELVLLSPQSDIVDLAYLPMPNRIVIFSAATLHVARSPSRSCPELRKSVIFKFFVKNSE
jgi:SM-20-related protein